MILNCDRFFISELNDSGFDLDYNQILAIYRASRLRPDCKSFQLKKIRAANFEATIEDAIFEKHHQGIQV